MVPDSDFEYILSIIGILSGMVWYIKRQSLAEEIRQENAKNVVATQSMGERLVRYHISVSNTANTAMRNDMRDMMRIIVIRRSETI